MSAPGVAGIVGLGLMGGSLARDLAAAGWRVQGTDRSVETETRARESGVVEGPLLLPQLDLLVLATASGWLRRLAPRLPPGCAITDVGSTKASIVETAEAVGVGDRFVGSHPMAGDHRSGWAAARTGLYRGASVWLCPTHESSDGAVTRVAALWRSIGADPHRIDAVAHDRLVARTSHVPQLAATALAGALARAGIRRDELGPGGRDTTRLAGSDPSMWADILVDNAENVVPALADLIRELEGVHRALRDLDDAGLRSRLAAARAWSRGEHEPDVDALGTEVA